jgi:N-dimethylarginine dimethylaminohydrolase
MKEQALEQHQQIQAYFEQAGLDIQQLKVIRDMVN